MPAFPDIETPEFPLEEPSEHGTVRSPFEAGYVQTRPRWTRARRTFLLTWKFLPAADFNALRAFFEDTVAGGGGSFTWTHPYTSAEHTVRFRDDALRFSMVSPGLYSGSVTLEEV